MVTRRPNKNLAQSEQTRSTPFRLLKVAAAALNQTVGDFQGNAGRVRAAIDEARRRRVGLLVLPEYAISGYSLEDRVHWQEVTDRSWRELERLAPATAAMTVVVGLPVRVDGMVFNAAAVLHDGRVLGATLKEKLPEYDVYFERRHTSDAYPGMRRDLPGGAPAGDLVFQLPYGKVTAVVCEDLWSPHGPASRRAFAGAEIVCHVNASNFAVGKPAHRLRMIAQRSADDLSVLVASNLSGLDSGRLLFDGQCVITCMGDVAAVQAVFPEADVALVSHVVDLEDVARQRRENTTWRSDCGEAHESGKAASVDVIRADGEVLRPELDEVPLPSGGSYFLPQDSPEPAGAAESQEPRESLVLRVGALASRSSAFEQLDAALVRTAADYIRKLRFPVAMLAISGGRDSSLTAVVMARAGELLHRLGYNDLRLDAYYLKGPFSSQETESAARTLVEELARRYAAVPLHFHVRDLRGSMEARRTEVLEALGEPERYDPANLGTALQNVQARARTVILDIANASRSLVFTTSNMSETFTGYTTTGGDNQGGYNLLVNMPKTVIQALLEWYLEGELAGSRGLEAVLAQPASAELAADQEDERDLCPYVVLDFILYEACELKRPWRRIAVDVAKAFEASLEIELRQAVAWTVRIGRLFLANQWKREQCPVGVKLFELDLDPKTGFRFPIICYDDELTELDRFLESGGETVEELLGSG